ncbi:MAG: ATP-dependent zinc metalloprotease FtsH [Candidatus Marinimicrobia bacterium]|nr:ATP-dependent zinc metalloprotease FtsH [Candidatus Neomarinimicrobiota bacterium]
MKETPDKTQKKKQSTPKRPAGPRKPVPPGKRPPQGARPPRGGSSPGQKPGGETGFDWKKAPKTPLIWIFIIVAVIFLANMFASNTIGEREITYTQFNEYLESGQVLEGEIIGNKFHGVLKSPQTVTVNGTRFEFTRFTLIIPFVDSPMLEKWDTYRLNYTFKEQNTNWTEVLIGIIPWILIIGLWIFWMRRLQGNGNGQKGIFSFGKSPAKMFNPEKTQVTFNDVAGCEEAKYELQEIIEFLRDPDRFQRLGGKIPRGALLLGPPGTGKTLLAKAAAGEAKVPFYSISGADFVEMFVGVGASRVRGLFEQAQKTSPCIVFIDEIDAVGRQRGAGLGGGHDEREQTLNQLLVQMDGFDSDSSVIVLAATNRPDILDKALLRPGRFDRQIVVDIPDVNGREGILKVHTKRIPLAKDVNLKILAKSTPGMVGADLANMVNEAALLAARKDKNSVEMRDFEDAKDKVLMGAERRSMIISDKDKKITAYHETGHALVALFLPEADPVHKVSIIPRGRALGVTHIMPVDDRHNYSRNYVLSQLQVLLGGRSAEEIVFEDITTGAGNDLERATGLARKMVCEWGMSSKLGPLTFGKQNEEIFLGREFGRTADYSEKTAREIDTEISEIVTFAHESAKKILTDHLDLLHKVADALLAREMLDNQELMDIIRESGIDTDTLVKGFSPNSPAENTEAPEDIKVQGDEGN